MESRADRPTVLIVEDHSDTLDLTCLVLDLAGFEVVSAATATAALEIIERGPVDAVVADIGLPDMDGYLFLRRLRLNATEMPLLAVTGWASAADRRRALSAGASAVLAKPCEPFELVGTLRQLLGKRPPGMP